MGGLLAQIIMKEIDQPTWFTEVTCSRTPVAVNFYAEWSPSSAEVETILEKYENSLAGRMKFVKMNIDKNEDLRISQRIITVPTLIIYYKGIPVIGAPGPQPEHVYESKINRAVRLYENRLRKKVSWR